MFLRIDSKDSSLFLIENQDGIQATFYIDENQIVIDSVNMDFYPESLALVEEYLSMKYSTISLWNSPIVLPDWQEYQSILIKNKIKSPYTMDVSTKEDL